MFVLSTFFCGNAVTFDDGDGYDGDDGVDQRDNRPPPSHFFFVTLDRSYIHTASTAGRPSGNGNDDLSKNGPVTTAN